MPKLEINIVSGYGSRVEIEVCENGRKKYVIDRFELTDYLQEVLDERGYTLTKENRQKYPRLHFNK